MNRSIYAKFVCLAAIGLTAVACNQVPSPTPEISATPDALLVIHTSSAAFSTSSVTPSQQASTQAAPSAVLTPADAAKLKLTGVIIEHTFSDKSMMRYQNVANHAIHNGDEAIADTEKLPEYVEFVEKEIAKGVTIKPQSISLNPSGCSGYVIFCVNPTSNYLWTVHVIPYEYENTVTAAQQVLIRASIDRWNALNSASGLRVIWQYKTVYTGVDRTVIFKSVAAGNAYCGQAYIGYQGRVSTAAFKRDYINVNTNPPQGTCFNDRTLHHEMGHVIGLPHEQTRCDRDQFVVYVRNDFYEGTNCGNDYTTWGRGFDFSSIMLYDFQDISPKRNASGTYIGSSFYTGNPNISISNSALSNVDIATINSMYAGR